MNNNPSNEDPKIARVSFSSEHDRPLYYDKHGNRVAVGLDDPMPYKPTYDVEVKDKSPNYPERTDNEWHIYFDIDTEIAQYKTRYYLTGWLKALRKILLHKYIWRHFS